MRAQFDLRVLERHPQDEGLSNLDRRRIRGRLGCPGSRRRPVFPVQDERNLKTTSQQIQKGLCLGEPRSGLFLLNLEGEGKGQTDNSSLHRGILPPTPNGCRSALEGTFSLNVWLWTVSPNLSPFYQLCVFNVS